MRTGVPIVPRTVERLRASRPSRRSAPHAGDLDGLRLLRWAVLLQMRIQRLPGFPPPVDPEPTIGISPYEHLDRCGKSGSVLCQIRLQVSASPDGHLVSDEDPIPPGVIAEDGCGQNCRPRSQGDERRREGRRGRPPKEGNDHASRFGNAGDQPLIVQWSPCSGIYQSGITFAAGCWLVKGMPECHGVRG